MMPLFSILIPAYNAENYIEECVQSCIDQNDLDDAEILIANDGSSDKTREICERLSADNYNVTVYNKNNEGLALTRKFLYSKARGRYILFLDSDDKWDLTLLHVIRDAIAKFNNPDIICFGFSTFNQRITIPFDRGDTRQSYYHDKSLNDGRSLFLTTDKYNSIWCKAIKKELYKNLILPKEWEQIKQGEDKLLTISLIEKARTICIIPDHLYLYRVSNPSMTRSFYPESINEVIYVDGVALSEMKQYGLDTDSNIQKWAESLVDKLYNYRINLENAGLNNKEKRKYISHYLDNKTVQKAIKACKWNSGIKYRIKACSLYSVIGVKCVSFLKG